jgi:hypothetical protein
MTKRERNEVPRIKNRAAYGRGVTTLPDWRIACCYVGKGHRRQGVATEALAGALDLIAGLGGGRVKGSPSSEDQQDTGSVQRPAEVLVEHGYREGEFAVPRRIAKPTFDEAVSHRTVLCRGLAHRTLPNSCRK